MQYDDEYPKETPAIPGDLGNCSKCVNQATLFWNDNTIGGCYICDECIELECWDLICDDILLWWNGESNKSDIIDAAHVEVLADGDDFEGFRVMSGEETTIITLEAVNSWLKEHKGEGK